MDNSMFGKWKPRETGRAIYTVVMMDGDGAWVRYDGDPPERRFRMSPEVIKATADRWPPLRPDPDPTLVALCNRYYAAIKAWSDFIRQPRPDVTDDSMVWEEAWQSLGDNCSDTCDTVMDRMRNIAAGSPSESTHADFMYFAQWARSQIRTPWCTCAHCDIHGERKPGLAESQEA